MSKKRHETTSLDRARDELFSHIHRCEVIGASEEQQNEWMEETIEFMAERYPDLTPRELEELKHLGLRFCQPVIPHGRQHTAPSDEEANAA
ncbi:MAG TPA: hypothetical protein VF188_14905 [Longimicrobiales bacterium]